MPLNTILVSVSGPDRPGITAALMDLLAKAGAVIDDVEQIVIRGHLSLSLVVRLDAEVDLRADLLLFGYEQKLQVEFEQVSSEPSAKAPGLVATLLGTTVGPTEFGAIAAVAAKHDGNIDRIIRVTKEPVLAYELAISCPDRTALRDALLSEANVLDCDIAVHRLGLARRAKRLVVLDVDSTLIQNEAIELLAAEAGALDEVAAVTERAMAGELDFAQSLATRVATLEGLEEAAIGRAIEQIQLTPGARTFIRTLKHLGYKTAIVSGGFDRFTEHLARELEIDYARANRLEVVDGRLTGKTTGPVVDRSAKAEFLRKLAEAEGIPLDQVVAVGDGANDLDMLTTAGLGVAFNAKAVVRRAADAAINVPYLDAILFVLGVNRIEIEEAGTELQLTPPDQR
ncbi:MAG: phosphoserine phosphatase SerB [Actinomycetota bacterium]